MIFSNSVYFSCYLLPRIYQKPKQAARKQNNNNYDNRYSITMSQVHHFSKNNQHNKSSHLPGKIHYPCYRPCIVSPYVNADGIIIGIVERKKDISGNQADCNDYIT